MSTLLASKLMLPKQKSTYLERAGLQTLLDRMDGQKLTVLTAPAGYGKTVLMSQLIGQSKKPFVWYQLDAYDNDPAVFWEYLVAGLEQQVPGFKNGIPLPLHAGMTVRCLVAAVLNGLGGQAGTGLILVLDDYHRINEPFIHRFVQELLKNLLPGLHMLLAGRTPPLLPVPRLVAQGEACVLGPEELRFTSREISEFFAQGGKPVPEEVLTMLEQKTAGWPAALQLLGDSDVPVAELSERPTVQRVYEYLAAEVFEEQPEVVRSFLLGTSILTELTPTACDRLLDRTDSAAVLGFLEKQRLFLTELQGARVYRYHQLFQEFLQERLGPSKGDLLLRAGRLSRQDGQGEEAVRYLMAAGFSAELCGAINEAGRQALDCGRWQTLAGWLEVLPPEVLAATPWLAFYTGKVDLYRGRLNDAERWAGKATALFQAADDQEGLLGSRLLQAAVWQRRGRYQECLGQLAWAKSVMAETGRAFGFELVLEEVFCLLFTGQYGEAETHLTAALDREERQGNQTALSRLWEGLGNVFWFQGRYPEALQVYRKAAELSPDRALAGYYSQDMMTRIYQDWGEGEQAFACIRRSIARKEAYGMDEALPSAYHLLGELYYDRGQWQEAEDCLTRAIGLLAENGGEHLARSMMLLSYAECLGLQGRWLEARAKVEAALAEAPVQSRHAVAVCNLYGFLPYVYTGSRQEGKERLLAAIDDFAAMGFIKGLGHAYLLLAWLYFEEGKLTVAREYTGKAIEQAARIQDHIVFLRWYSLFQPLLALGLETGRETVFLQRILRQLGERALPLLLKLAGHADPAVRRQSLATLQELDGKAVRQTVGRLMKQDADASVRQLAKLAAQRLGIVECASRESCIAGGLLQLRMFGPFEVATAAGAINWRTIKTRDLLAYLAHQAGPVGKERILDELWPDADPYSAANNFRTTLYYLRKALQQVGYPAAICYSNKQCRLAPEYFSSDLQRFQTAVMAGLRGHTGWEEVIPHLEQAVDLYLGDYLGDLDYPWLLHQRENCSILYAAARKRLAHYYLENRNYTRAVLHMQSLEEYDPLDEEVQTMLLTVLAKQGNRPAVIRQYRKLEELYKRELGLSPSPQLRNLYLKLRQ